MQKIRNTIGGATSEPFVLATGLAALVHSTWSLAMLFSGAIPDVRTQPLGWAGAILPAFLLAFSIDVGQIMTSRDIRRGMRNSGKVLTFAALAFATYYLQWMFMVAHVPEIALGAGVRMEWVALVERIRDLSIWFVPALLPIATTLYTISNADKRIAAQVQRDERNAARMRPTRVLVAQPIAMAPGAPVAELAQGAAQAHSASGPTGGAFTNELVDAVLENADETFTGYCPACDYHTEAKPTERAAKAALAAHKRRCVGAVTVHENGNGAH